MRVVVDTNVLVSALLSQNSPTSQVVQNLLAASIPQLLLSPDLLAEYEEVLNRKKFATAFDADDVRLLLGTITTNSLFIVPAVAITECEDVDDNMVLSLAVDGLADCIVSGDNHLLALHPFRGIPIISAADFVKMFSALFNI